MTLGRGGIRLKDRAKPVATCQKEQTITAHVHPQQKVGERRAQLGGILRNSDLKWREERDATGQ